MLRRVDAAELSLAERRKLFELYFRAFNGEPDWLRRGGSPDTAFEWKALESPSRSEFTLVEDGDRLAGAELAMGKQFLLGGRTVVASDSVDSAIDPDYQGQGLDSKRRAAGEELPPREGCFICWFPTHPTSQVQRGIERDDRLVLPLTAIARPLSFRGLLRNRVQSRSPRGRSRTAAVLGGGRARGLRLLSPTTAATVARVVAARMRPLRRAEMSGVEIESVSTFGPAIESFWGKASADWDLIQKRDRAYLNWRYSDPRSGGFTLRVAREQDEIVGFTASRLGQDDAVLADLLALPDRLEIVNLLLSDVTRLAKRAGAPALRSWLTRSHPYREVFRAGGFIEYETRRSFGVMPSECPMEELTLLGEPDAVVHLMPGDSDHV